MSEYNQFEHGDMIQISIERTVGGSYQKKETLRVFYMTRSQYQERRWNWYVKYVVAVYQVKFPKESVSAGFFHYTVKDGAKKRNRL